MPTSNKINGIDNLSELFGSIIVTNRNDVSSMNSIFGAIRRDREEAAAAEAATTQSVPKAAPVAEESRKALAKDHEGNIVMSGDDVKISSQHRRNEKSITRNTDNDKITPFKDNDTERNGNAAPAPRKVLQEKPTMRGKQIGTFATQPIPRHTDILREAPLISGGPTWPGREAAYNLLSPSKRAAVDSLSSMCMCGKKPEFCLETPLMKRWAINSFVINPFLQVGDVTNNNFIYDKACRTNHAGLPNCSRSFHSEHSISIRAMRDIKKGEEITINYGVYGSASFPRTNISERWKFTCTCTTCVKGEFGIILCNGFRLIL
ncbi:hypothetical protein BPOR_0589g00060 [Botrytis porri]|uniref:SET domain-containing protein n=1 Tax=Botrytis porri TaxID=87229 RepID=A0A4Z1KQK4_9HELO|nr:hypothetical protein BPOR_0589g00060 [Botrytis porri]